MNDRHLAWVSAETEPKEHDFRGILRMHINACKGILGRQADPDPYLYVDLYAGPGNLEYKGRKFLGSPLIFQDEATKAGLSSLAVHFDSDPEVTKLLAEALYVPTSLIDCPDDALAPIFTEDFQAGFPLWLAEFGSQPNRHGLIYADPIKDEIPYELLNSAAEMLPRVDLLSYVSATQYKRRRGGEMRRNGHSRRPLLSEHVHAVDKRYALIRKPRSQWQFVFILWSNWGALPEWNQRGFYRLDSPEGRQILEGLDLTEPQKKERANTPLWELTR